MVRLLCRKLESAWYFNCSVYGKTFDEKRIKFDIFDDIHYNIAKRPLTIYSVHLRNTMNIYSINSKFIYIFL